MPQTVRKRSVTIAGHRTSISLEEEFWVALKALANRESRPLNDLITEIDAQRGNRNLSSALRVHILKTLQQEFDPENHGADDEA